MTSHRNFHQYLLNIQQTETYLFLFRVNKVFFGLQFNNSRKYVIRHLFDVRMQNVFDVPKPHNSSGFFQLFLFLFEQQINSKKFDLRKRKYVVNV